MNKIIKFNRKLKKKTSVLCVLDYSNKTNKVIEVIGSYNFINKNLDINIFRFIYWISKNIKLSGEVFQVLLKFNIIRLKKNIKNDKNRKSI